jgi:molybdopterin synthase catalytic subunit
MKKTDKEIEDKIQNKAAEFEKMIGKINIPIDTKSDTIAAKHIDEVFIGLEMNKDYFKKCADIIEKAYVKKNRMWRQGEK